VGNSGRWTWALGLWESHGGNASGTVGSFLLTWWSKTVACMYGDVVALIAARRNLGDQAGRLRNVLRRSPSRLMSCAVVAVSQVRLLAAVLPPARALFVLVNGVGIGSRLSMLAAPVSAGVRVGADARELKNRIRFERARPCTRTSDSCARADDRGGWGDRK
jgi:hypothetical protein